jgi:polysaccharide pyruvyl transferase WcaK-like protein
VRILVVHGWVTGNLGDVLQTTVLLEHLRSLGPTRLDLAGWPHVPAAGCAPMLAPVDRFLPEDAWREKPRRPLPQLRRALRSGRWIVERARLFREYDVVLSAPGPFLSDADPRSRMALHDLRAARLVGRPFVLASHSIGPLDDAGLRALRATDLIVSREPDTHDYLTTHGVRSENAADLAFLFPLRARADRPASRPSGGLGREHRLAFLRSDNLDLRRLRFEAGALRVGEVEVIGPARTKLVLATSDPHRDRRWLADLASRCGEVEVRICETVWELIDLIEGATEVATDRYHPAVLAAAAGKPLTLVETPGWRKMAGLRRLLATLPLDEIRGRARAGLERVSERIRAARP